MPFREMQEVLLDIHLAETYSQGLGDTTGNKFDKNYDSLAVFYTSVLQHHKLSFKAFNEALAWYRERPRQMDSLYTGVIDRLNTLKAQKGIRDIDDQNGNTLPERDKVKEGAGKKDSTAAGKPKADTVQRNPTLRAKPTTQEEL